MKKFKAYEIMESGERNECLVTVDSPWVDINNDHTVVGMDAESQGQYLDNYEKSACYPNRKVHFE